MAWSELATTNAPIEDEAVEPVSRMNILPAPARMGFFFRILPAPKFSTKNFLYLPPPSSPILPPSYLPPTSPRLPTTYQPHTPSLHRQSSRDVEHLELELKLEQELELGSWSWSVEAEVGRMHARGKMAHTFFFFVL